MLIDLGRRRVSGGMGIIDNDRLLDENEEYVQQQHATGAPSTPSVYLLINEVLLILLVDTRSTGGHRGYREGISSGTKGFHMKGRKVP
jgi:hypothetical protein